MHILSGICRICQSNDLAPKFEVKTSILEKCNICGFVQVANKPSEEEFNKIYSNDYFSHSKYQDLNALRKENLRRLNLLHGFLKQKDFKILDAGCASGDFIKFVDNQFQMWGIDFSSYAIEKAKEKNPQIAGRLSTGLIEEQRFETAFFDAIVLWDVIEHIWDPKETITKLLDYIKPGGFLFLSTPNIDAPFAKVMGKYWPFMTPPEHLSFLTKKSFLSLTKDLNGKIISWHSKGKWANVGFILYKIQRIAPKIMPHALISLFNTRFLKKLSIYVPTGDVQYLVIKKT